MPEITIVQTELAWESPGDNRAHFDELLADTASTDLIVLPEMFSTGFSMASRRLAEPHNGPTVEWMKTKAAERGACVCGSIMTEDGGEHFNRFYLAHPDGSSDFYDKRHLFRMGEENDNYSAGRQRLVMRAGGMTLFPQVCYDLRFPVFSRNDLGFEVMIFVANWPAPRRHHWRTLLRARAIENLCYVVGVNRIGVDGNGIDHAGDSAIIDPRGETLADLEQDDAMTTTSIDLDELHSYREKFPAWKDADAFQLTEFN